MTDLLPPPLTAALGRPEGAQWVRCALQVNPFAYFASNGRVAPADDQETYDRELVAELVHHQIGLVGLTDHWRARESVSLQIAAAAAGITVLPGFEATSSEGAHLLVLFEPGTPLEELERRIGECGRDFTSGASSPSTKRFVELLQVAAHEWGATVLAPHVAAPVNGLLGKLSGLSRVAAWTHPDLHGIGLAGAELSIGELDIVEGRSPEYRRVHAPAILNAGDVNGAAAVARPASTDWIKLSALSAAGLDLALRTPETRVRSEDPRVVSHARLVAMSWEGGFIDGLGLHFNEGLNVLIGGRGSGKSTVIESVRFVLGLDAVTDRGRSQHRAVVDQVLGSATTVRALVECAEPTPYRYRIERTVGSLSNVYDAVSGALLQSTPRDVLPSVDVYGQRELAEVADDKAYQTALLGRLLPVDARPTENGLRPALETNRGNLTRVLAEVERVEDELARLPVLREQLQRMADAGVPAQLRDENNLQREDRILEVAHERANDVLEELRPLGDAQHPDRNFVSAAALLNLPHADLLRDIDLMVEELGAGLEQALLRADQAVSTYQADLADLQQRFQQATAEQRAEVGVRLRELKAQGIDGAAYLQLERALARAEPLEAERVRWTQERDELRHQRTTLVVALEDPTAADVRRLDGVGRGLSSRMGGLLRVSVAQQLDAELLTALIREHVGGQLAALLRAVSVRVTSGRALADAGRTGAELLNTLLGEVPRAQVDRLAMAAEHLWLLVEEHIAQPRPLIELNIGTTVQPVWHPLELLSSGQKATALLLLLLSQSGAPLLIDQPEDDLDNAFVSTSIVPQLRAQKDVRQFILCSHNANIPVLADADLLAALDVQHIDGRLSAHLPDDRLGSLDAPAVGTVSLTVFPAV